MVRKGSPNICAFSYGLPVEAFSVIEAVEALSSEFTKETVVLLVISIVTLLVKG